MLQEVKKHFDHKTALDEIDSIKKDFLKILEKIRNVFGSNIKIGNLVNDNNKKKSSYPILALLDVLIVAFSEEDKNFLLKYRDEILERIRLFFNDEAHRAFIQNSKKGRKRISTPFSERIELFKSHTLDSVKEKYHIEKAQRINIRDPKLEDELMEKQKGICPYCKNQIKPNDKYEIDHLQSIDDFGSNHKDNLALLHVACNKEKSNKKILMD